MKKKTQIIVLCTAIGLLGIAIFFPVKGDKDKSKFFGNYQSDFEKMNRYVDEYYRDQKAGEKANLSFTPNDFGIIEELYDGNNISLDTEHSNALTNVKNAFKYDFSLISVTNERISYGGEGHEMYVYMKKGWFPTYFYSKDDGCSFTCYSLGNHWYYLLLKQR